MLDTPRLAIRPFTADDAPFVLELVNDPDFLLHIGDRKVRTLDDARAYIANGPQASYEKNGFGLSVVALKATGEAIGMCGLIRRDHLEDVDIGYAFLPEHRGQGYAREAAAATLAEARALGLGRILAVVSPANERSIALLEKLGFTYERMVRMPGDEVDIRLYAAG